jgi:hypothetical protein
MTDRTATRDAAQAPVNGLRASAYRIPTDAPEADGTFVWKATTLVVVEVDAAGQTGIGYTYSDKSLVTLIHDTLGECVLHSDVWDIRAVWQRMQRQVRNLGRSGLAATAISAMDCALWDLKAKLLGVPLVRLLGAARESVPLYGSGGFTTYSDKQMREQLAGWVERMVAAGSRSRSGPSRRKIPGAWKRRARRLAMRDFSWTPMARSHRSRRYIGLNVSRSSALSGSKNRSLRTTPPACVSCASTRQPAWRSPLANTATRSTTSGSYWPRNRSMLFRPT